jgi:cysteine-rich repeat protein
VRDIATEARAIAWLALGLALSPGCTVPNPNALQDTVSSEGDSSAPDEGDAAQASESDDASGESGSTSSESESSGDASCTPGALDCECDAGECEAGLSCVDGWCETASCGNGVLDEGEQCDDANEDEQDGCRSNCQLTESPTCDNGQIDPLEFCFDAPLTFSTTDGDIRGLQLDDLNADGELDLVLVDRGKLLALTLMSPVDAESVLDETHSFDHELYPALPNGGLLGRFLTSDRVALALDSPGPDAMVTTWEFAPAGPNLVMGFGWIPLESGQEGLHVATVAKFDDSELEWAIYGSDDQTQISMTSAGQDFVSGTLPVRDLTSLDLGDGRRNRIVAVNPEDPGVDLYTREFGSLVHNFSVPLETPDLITRVKLDDDNLEDAAVISIAYCQDAPVQDCPPGFLHRLLGSEDTTEPLTLVPGGGLPTLPNVYALTSGDLNADGRDDVILYSEAAQQLEIVESDPELVGAFRRYIDLPADTFDELTYLEAGDLNADGVDDLAFAAAQSDKLYLILSNP